MIREDVYRGFWSWIENHISLDVVTLSRQLQHWNDVPADLQPAVFMTQTGETRLSSGIGWKLDIDLYVYTHSNSDPGTISATAMNDVIDKIIDCLQPNIKLGEVVQTLGNLVEDCHISGKIETDAGLLGPQSVAIIPITIFVSN